MGTHQYSIRIFWSDEDESYIALVSEFPGISAFGETVEEAGREVCTALEGIILSLQKDELELPEPQKIQAWSKQ